MFEDYNEQDRLKLGMTHDQYWVWKTTGRKESAGYTAKPKPPKSLDRIQSKLSGLTEEQRGVVLQVVLAFEQTNKVKSRPTPNRKTPDCRGVSMATAYALSASAFTAGVIGGL